MSVYDSGDESVSDVPYGWSGFSEDREARMAASHSKISKEAIMSSQDEASTTNPRRRRNIWQIPDDSEGEQDVSPAVNTAPTATFPTSTVPVRLQAQVTPSTPTTQLLPSPNKPHISSTPAASGRSDRFRLRRIKALEGNISSLPQQLQDDLQNWCKLHKTKNLPCAKGKWTTGSTVKMALGKGSSTKRGRKWITDDTGEELDVGRFAYGWEQQIIVVQARVGSLWEGGDVVVIVNVGQGGPHWKVWRGEERADDMPTTRKGVRCRFIPIEGLGKGHEEVAVNNEPGQFSKHEHTHAGAGHSTLNSRRVKHLQSTPPTTSFEKNMEQDASGRRTQPATDSKSTDLHVRTDMHHTGIETPLPSGSTIVVAAPKPTAVSTIAKAVVTDIMNAVATPQDVGKAPKKVVGADNNHPLKSSRRRSDSSDSDIPIAIQKRKRLRTTVLADVHTPSDHTRSLLQHNNARVGPPPLAMGLIVPGASTKPTSHQLPSHIIDTASETATATPYVSAKPSDISLHRSRASMKVETVLKAPLTDGLIVPTNDSGTAMVLFIDAAGKEALNCVLGELEDTDDLFARARVAGIINKNVRLLEVVCGGETILVQKRFAQDFGVLKQKVLEKKPGTIWVESGG